MNKICQKCHGRGRIEIDGALVTCEACEGSGWTLEDAHDVS